MMAPLAAEAVLMVLVGGVVLVLAFFLLRPTSGQFEKRAEALVRSVAAGRPRQPEAFMPSGRTRFPMQIFMLGMPRKWGVSSGPLSLSLVGCVAAGVVWLVTSRLLGLSLVEDLPLLVATAWVMPNAFLRVEQRRADKRFVQLFPDAIDMIVRMLRANLPVSRAIRTVAKEAPAPISNTFTVLADQMDVGVSFENALDGASKRIGLPDFRFFAAAVALQHTTGGNLVTTLEILAEIIRRRRTVRMKARAATGEVRMTAYILSAIPFLIVGALAFTDPEYLAPLVADPRGRFILALGAVLLLLGFLTMRSMMRSVERA
jgi:tight adherence protein B